MKSKPKAKPTVIGGYAKRRQQKLKALEPKTTPAPPAPEGRPVPAGIKEVLATMSQLARDIDGITKEPFTVSIEVDTDNEWILIVRGWKPHFQYYGGYKVKHVQSSFIRNPLARS